ncbi:MAG: exodeoxyribonuclease VII large subunit, partial [Chitinophagaceae bacterium]
NCYTAAAKAMQNSLEQINSLEKAVLRLDEASTLKRGFSITRLNKQAIDTLEQLKCGDQISTSFKDGHIISTITIIQKHEPNA